MLVRFIDENEIKKLEEVAFLTINGEKHLIINPQNQPLEILNANGIYEYVDKKPTYDPNTHYLDESYKLDQNKVYSVYEIKELGEEG